MVTNVGHDSDIARQEIFGPVMSLHGFDTDDEAWNLANATDYGLAAFVWTSSLRRAEQARRRLQCGIVWINCVHTLSAGTPVCGHKTSGLGIEYGLGAADQYTRVKTTVVMSGGWQSPFADAAAT